MDKNMFKCLCDSRGLTSSISQILNDENLTAEEKTVLYDSLLDVQNAANRIQEFCHRIR